MPATLISLLPIMLMFVIGIFFLSLIVKVVLALALVEAIVTSYVPAVTLSVRVIFMPVVSFEMVNLFVTSVLFLVIFMFKVFGFTFVRFKVI